MRPPKASAPLSPAAESVADCCPIKAVVSAIAPKLRQRRKEARPQELLEAALNLFVDKGLSATRTDDVAKLAGVSKGTLYLYYPSKDALFKAVVQTYLEQVLAEGSDILAQYQGSSAELIRLLMRTWWERVGPSKASGLMLLCMAEATKFPDLAQYYVDHVIEPTHALLGQAIQRGIDRGEFRPLDVRMVVLALIAPIHFLTSHKHSLAMCATTLPAIDPFDYLDVQLSLLLEGMIVRPTPQP